MQKKVSFEVSSPEEDEFSVSLKDSHTSEVLPLMNIKVDVDISQSFAKITSRYEFLSIEETESTIFLEIVQPKNIVLDSISIKTLDNTIIYNENNLGTTDLINSNDNNTIVFNDKLKLSAGERPEVTYTCIAKLNVEYDDAHQYVLPCSFFEHIFNEKERQLFLKHSHTEGGNDSHAHTSAPYTVKIILNESNGVKEISSKMGHQIHTTFNDDRTSVEITHCCDDPRGLGKDLVLNYSLLNRTQTKVSFIQGKNNSYYMYMNYNPLDGFIRLNLDDITELPKWVEYDEPMVYYFGIDRSLRMIGDNFDAVIETFDTFLASVPSQCLFNVISIGDNSTFMFETAVEANMENREEAKKLIADYSANSNVCNLIKFFQFYKNEVICNSNNDYAYNPQRLFIFTNSLESATKFHFQEQFQDNDIQFFFFSFSKNVEMSVEEVIAQKMNGKFITFDHLDDIPSVLSHYMAKTIRPYLYSFSTSINEDYNKQFIGNSLNNEFFTKVKNLKSNVEVLTKIKVPSNKIGDKLNLFVNFSALGGNIISEEFPLTVTNSDGEYFDKFFDYHFAKKSPPEVIQRSDSVVWHLCAHIHCAACQDNLFKDISSDVYLGDKLKFTLVSKENWPVKKFIKKISTRLGFLLEQLTITSKGKLVDYDGTLKDHADDINGRIDVIRNLPPKEHELDRLLMKNIADNYWKYDPDLFTKIGCNENKWSEIKKKLKLSEDLSEETLKAFKENEDDIISTIYITNYLKSVFAKRNYDAVFINSERALKGMVPELTNDVIESIKTAF